uniref:Putative nucleoprotein n=1 Tax=Beihai bunya-like virus 2 TaxID=1922372 RepID=A0A1L3KPE1_9VIRU|nr:putative nucleoprotein [Beihai bunya-like virus 2]
MDWNDKELSMFKAYFTKGETSNLIMSLIEEMGRVSVSAINTTLTHEFIESIRYQGFDVKYSYLKLRSCCKSLGDFNTDVLKMACLFNWRGNNITRAASTMTRTGQDEVNRLITKYGIVNRVDEKRRRDSITLARVCMTFPLHCLQMQLSHPPEPVNPCMISIHPVVRHPIALSFLATRSDLYHQSLCCTIMLGAVIGQKDDTIRKTLRFVRAGQSSSLRLREEVNNFFKWLNLEQALGNWSDISSAVMTVLMDEGQTLQAASHSLEILFCRLKAPLTWPNPQTTRYKPLYSAQERMES